MTLGARVRRCASVVFVTCVCASGFAHASVFGQLRTHQQVDSVDVAPASEEVSAKKSTAEEQSEGTVDVSSPGEETLEMRAPADADQTSASEVRAPETSSAGESIEAPPARFGGNSRPSELSEAELRARGWEVSDELFRPGDIWGGLLAATGGLVVHGAGHFYVGDRDFGLRLLASELVAVAAFGIGSLINARGTDSDAAHYAGAALQVAGGGLFAWSWLGDVIGTFKSTTVRLPDPTDRPNGFSGQLLYSSIFGSPVTIGSLAELALSYNGEQFEIEGRGEYAPIPRFYSAMVRVGYRIPIGRESRTALTVEGRIGEEAALEHGWGRDRASLGLAATVDMGELLPHVRGLLWKLRILGWADFYFYETQGFRRLMGENARWHVPVETGLGMNANQGIYLEVGYRHRSDLLIGSLFESGGAFYQKFSILPVEAFGIEFEISEAEYIRLHVGIRWQLSTTEE